MYVSILYVATSVLVNVLKNAWPMLLKAGEMIDKMEPYLNIVQDKLAMAYQVIEPYHPVELIPIFWGFIMIFFGG